MKREIKFRAWDGSMMVYVNEMKYIRLYDDRSGEIIDDNDRCILDIDQETPLMQFTGLKDKNGKEIYEGDILKSESWGKDTRLKNPYHLVEWQCCGWKALGYNGQMRVNPDLDVKRDWEIVGNIYESPELCI